MAAKVFHSVNKMCSPTDRIGGRWYLFQDGIAAFGSDPRRKAKEFLPGALRALETQVGIVPYFLGFFWGERDKVLLDLFVCRDATGPWDGKYSLQAFRYEDATLSAQPGMFPRPEIFTVLATEGKHRSHSRNLSHYLAEAPRYPPEYVTFTF